MTKGSGRMKKRSKNNSEKRDKATKKNNLKVQALAKLQCEKNRQICEDSTKSEKGARIDRDNPACPDALVQLSPLSCMGWDSVKDVPLNTVCRDQSFRHSKNFIQKHPKIQPQMRSILLDWLIEVSEAYALHRQTFYLAQDYFDRFMLTQNNIEKGVLQLIGITCLFIASKMEEANPPKLSEMAYVTAGTFYEDEILKMELIILKALRWNLCPETAVSWLTLFFQLASMNAKSDLLEPQFPPDVYIQMARLLDLCMLNINSLDFYYHVLAASVCCNFVNQELVERVSGLPNDLIQPCVNWMAPFAESAGQSGQATLRDFTGIKKEDRHNIQTHAGYLTMLDEVSKKQMNTQLPTHPNSTEKTCKHTEQ